MKILVTGGAGYIGGFMASTLLDLGHEVVIADNLSKGYKEAVDSRAQLLTGDLLDKGFVSSLFSNQVEAVIHFAAFISVSESMEKPSKYFENNIMGTLNLVDSAINNNANKIIFSSSAAVYGNPTGIPIIEDHAKIPTNPYGESKLMSEKILSWYNKINNLNFVSLRYFNACGASPDGSRGERHNPEIHIIPNAIRALLTAREFILYGDDYSTDDGTCVRDYIHVLDLVGAHLLALEKLRDNPGGYYYNVGTGTGYSNKQVLEMVEKIGGKKINIKINDRRPGDPAILIADPTSIEKELGFKPKYSDLETIIRTAFKWHQRQFNI